VPTAETPNFAVRRLFVTILTVFILIVAIGVPVAVLGPVPQAAATVAAAQPTTTSPAKVVFPSFGHAAVGVVGMPGVLATSGSQAPRPIASITKVVTALVVLEKKPIEGKGDGPTLTFTERDVAYLSDVMAQDGSSEPVQAGWKMPERRAIETMLIPSANNYAESLAVWAYGSVPKYLAAARSFLDAHGLTHTTLVDTNGLNQGDRSTPADLVALGKLALASPVIAAAVKQSVATEPNVGQIQNTNALLGTLGVNGIKTGTTDQAGACLLFSAQAAVGSRTVQIVGVILGAPTHPQLDATVPNLLTSVRKGLHDVPLAAKGQPLATYHTKWGGVAKAVAKTDADVLVWGRQTVQRTADVAPIRGGKKGQAVGSAIYRVGGQSVPVTLVLDRSVLAAPFWWRLTHPLR
jgi:D-alanyl-D-alanine carboxypeptidase (penicillin-binding protein 5/6)